MKKNIIITAVIVGIISIIGFILAGVFKTQCQYLETLYFISQVINCIVVAFGVVFAAWQYYLSLVDSKRQSDIIRVQKAIDLAHYYKDSILKKYPPIRYILDESGIADILKKVPPVNMQSFDSMELYKFISEEDKDKLHELQMSDKFFEALLDANTIYDMKFTINKEIQSVEEKDDKTKCVTYAIDKTPVVAAFMRNYLTETLNNMEFFAMHFYHNAADSSVIYQSLHQSYIEIVEYLYYFIAFENTNSVDKFYTNIIALYHKWKEEQISNESKRKAQEQEHQTSGTVIN